MKFSNEEFYDRELNQNNPMIYHNPYEIPFPIHNLKENSKQNDLINNEQHMYTAKNNNNDILLMKSVSFRSNKKIYNTKGALTEKNMINLMNKYINYSMHKKRKKKKLKTKYEENKEINMENLIKKGLLIDIKNLKKNKNNNTKDKELQKKKDYLYNLGIETNSINSYKENSKDNKDINNENLFYEFYNDKKYNTLNNFYTTNKKIKHHSPPVNNNIESSPEKDKKNRKELKPKINQFEYINKIKKERYKIKTEPNYLSVQAKSTSSKLSTIISPKITTTLNDSFRHSNKKIKKRIYTPHNSKKENKINLKKVGKKLINLNIKTKDEYPYAERKTHRSPDELHFYIRNKRALMKNIEDKKINKKYKDIFAKFKNLCNLNHNISPKYNANNDNTKKRKKNHNSPGYYNTIPSRYKTLTLNTKLNSNYKKDSNNKKTLLANEPKKNLNSTLIDADEYYLNILESKKLLRNHIYNKTEFNFYKKKYQKEETKDNENNLIKNIFVINNNKDDKKEMIKKISKKIIDTLIKAKKVFNDNNDNVIDNENEKEIKNSNNIISENKIDKEEKNIKSDEKIINEKKEDNEEVNEEDIKNNIISDISNKDEKNYKNIDLNEKEDIKFNIIEKDHTKQKSKNDDLKNEKNNLINQDNNDEDNKINNYIKEKEKSKEKMLNITKIINNIFKKNIFRIIYNYYIRIVITENYFIAIKYIISIIKKFPFIKLKKNLYNHKIFFALNSLISPFIINAKKIFFNKLNEIPKVIKKQNNSDNINNYNDDEGLSELYKNCPNTINKAEQTKENNINENLFINEQNNNKEIEPINIDEIKLNVDEIKEEKNINNDNNEKELNNIKKDDNNIIDSNPINEILNDKNINNNIPELEPENIADEKKSKNIITPQKINIDELTEEIISKILISELSSKECLLIPKKKFRFKSKLKKSRSNLSSNSTENLKKDINLLDLNNISELSDENLSALNDSIMEAYSQKSFFNKTIIDKKKIYSIFFYKRKIAPLLINLLKQEIISKYDKIYKNISTPYENNSEEIMISLILQDAEMLRDNFKIQKHEGSISDIINRDELLQKFEPINIKLREKWNLKNKKNEKDNINGIKYDQYMNKAIIDCCIEVINCERKYGENGNPLIWSSRMRELQFKYPENDPTKLVNFVEKNIYEFLNQKNGLICENYENIPSDIISKEREKRLIKSIKNELYEGDYLWRNLEMEETQIKVEMSDCIAEQLYNEVIEILEHIQLSRNKGELYHYKSIYACEDMPKLSFQQTTTENVDNDDNENNILFNNV